jgi:enterochelin esterase-like enzyme
LNDDWDFVVYEPPGHDGSARRLPVVYLLHGNYGGPADFVDQGGLARTADRLISECRIAPAVVAMPDGRRSWWIDHGATRMETAVFEEFIPRIEATERVAASRASRAIGGISMGGYGALRYALKRPEMFAAVALMSPAVYSDAPRDGSSALDSEPFLTANAAGQSVFSRDLWAAEAYPRLLAARAPGASPRFRVDSGAEDEFGIAGEARRLHEALLARGFDSTFALRPGGHDWNVWTPALEAALVFMLGGAPEPAV